MSLRNLISSVVVGGIITFLLWLWFHPGRVLEELSPNVLPVEEASPTPAPSIPPPTPAEAQEKLDKVFRRVLVIDPEAKPSLTAGDFNLDSSIDLAVAVKPRSDGLAELNGELPAWLPQAGLLRLQPEATPPPIHIAAGDSLLAIIHGYGAEGWRNADALQAYLLTGVRGS